MNERREYIIFLTAGPGDVRAARSVVSRGFKDALGRHKQGTAPHFIFYTKANAEGEDLPAHYNIELTDEELEDVVVRITRLANDAGFTGTPIDVYEVGA